MGRGLGRWIVGLVVLWGLVPLYGGKPVQKPLDLRSSSALVLDQQTGELLFQKRPGDILPIASITKLATAMVVLDARLDLEEEITIDQADVDLLRHSKSRLPVGTRLSRGQALHLALMSSENRAAHALGRTYPQGLEAFTAAMNAKAKSLALTETRFVDPSGLSGQNVSSAKDLARLVEAAFHYPLIRSYTTCDEVTIRGIRRPITFSNSNRLVKSSQWQIGLSKTGFIQEAGRCLVMQAWVAQRSVVIVLLDSVGKLTRFGDANRIKQWMEGMALMAEVPRIPH
jgi:D-alanyl-D-alanine endopeptidase (penicillin-binding protein 7)